MTREKFSLLLIIMGVIMAFLPLKATRSFSSSPEKLLARSLDKNSILTVDQVARYISNEDPTIHLIDLRSSVEFKKSSLPGAENVPYAEMLDRDPSTYLGSGNFRNIFYSNGDLVSGYALAIAGGLGYKNCYIMKGGMNGWIETVMNTTFSGETISARENSIFEARTKAGKLFREVNALPDSLKIKYLSSKRFDRKKLDGGCE